MEVVERHRPVFFLAAERLQTTAVEYVLHEETDAGT